MIEPNRIDAGVARNLLKRAGPNTDPNPLIEEAFRRGFGLGLRCEFPVDQVLRVQPGTSRADALDPDAPRAGVTGLMCAMPAALFFGVTSSQGFA